MERWLTFEDLCSELHLKPYQVRKLVKTGKVVGLCYGNPRRIQSDWRFLDPAPKYKKALELQQQILAHSLSIDLGEVPLLSTADFAQLCGFTQTRVRGLINRKVLTPYKVGRYSFFTANQLRDFLNRRQGRSNRYRRPSMARLLEWCGKYAAAGSEHYLSRAAIRKDDELEGEIQGILRLKEPQRTIAMKTFWRRYELAKEAARLIAAPSQSR